jgi:hypothetical protein
MQTDMSRDLDDEIRFCFRAETTLSIQRLHIVAGAKPPRTLYTPLSDKIHVFSLALALLKHTSNSRDIFSFTVEMKDSDSERNELGRIPRCHPSHPVVIISI